MNLAGQWCFIVGTIELQGLVSLSHKELEDLFWDINRLNATPVRITVIQVYAPTSVADEKDIRLFYDQLQATIADVSSKDVLLVIGDFNARVGMGKE